VEARGTGDGEVLRMTTQTGLPAGDDVFVAKIAELTGRDLSKGKPDARENVKLHLYTTER